MVGDNHLHAQRARPVDLLKGRNARVDRDDQPDALGVNGVHRPDAQAVALAQAVGNIINNIGSLSTEIPGQQAGRCDAVHIVIAEDRDLLSPADRAPHHLDRARHIGQPHRIVQRGRITGQEGARLLRGADPAGTERCCRQRRKTAGGRE